MVKKESSGLLIFFLIVLIDMIGIGLAIPIISELLLDNQGILSNLLIHYREIILGFLIASFALAQFIGAPLLGALSDRYGRKPLLIASLIGTFIGYIIFAIGINLSSIYLLFAGRIFAGFMGGNISIVTSSIADKSTQKDKAKNFGIIGMAFGLGFIIGPFLGGKLSDSNFVSWFNYTTPFYVASALVLINLIFVMYKFKETLNKKIESKISALTGFKNIFKALKMKHLRATFLMIFLFSLGFSFFTQFSQVFLIQKFSYSPSQIGGFFAYLGICVALVQGILTRFFSKKFRPEQILKVTLVFLSLFLFIYILPSKSWVLYTIIPFIAIFSGLSMPNTTALVSNLSDKKSQGEILGINQSIQALGQALPPMIAGFIVGINMNLPTIVASILVLASWIVFIIFYDRKKEELFHEI